MTQARDILQVVPRLGARSDGVADYARCLAAALSERAGIDSSYLLGDPGDTGAGVAAGWVGSVDDRSAVSVASALEAWAAHRGAGARAGVLLHYANYGYSPRGCPAWLVEGLELWKQRSPGTPLTTVFHEIYASGPPWRSSFWLSPVQRHLAGRLARLSDVAVTSTELYRRKIALWSPGKGGRIQLRPVFSTIGEPPEIAPWDDREPLLAVLGRAGTELRAYGPWRECLSRAVRALGIKRIVDIGPRTGRVPLEVGGVEVQATGHLPKEDVSALLSRCRAGFLDYPSDVLAKSTVFAAYCAHAVVPLVTLVRDAGADGLREGEHFLALRTGTGDEGSIRSAARNIPGIVSAWYRGHRLQVHADALAGVLA